MYSEEGTWTTSSTRSLQRCALGCRLSPSGKPHGLSRLGTGLCSLSLILLLLLPPPPLFPVTPKRGPKWRLKNHIHTSNLGTIAEETRGDRLTWQPPLSCSPHARRRREIRRSSRRRLLLLPLAGRSPPRCDAETKMPTLQPI